MPGCENQVSPIFSCRTPVLQLPYASNGLILSYWKLPFGVFIHESARAFCKDGEEPFGFRWWKWFLTQPAQQWDKDRIKSLAAAVDTYFSNCEELNMSLDYPLEKIKAHRKAAKEYFADINDAEESKAFSSLPAER